MRWTVLVSTLFLAAPTRPCTVFFVSDGTRMLVGNNEDYFDPATRMWFLPAEAGKQRALLVLLVAGDRSVHPLQNVFDGRARLVVVRTIEVSGGAAGLARPLLEASMRAEEPLEGIVRHGHSRAQGEPGCQCIARSQPGSR